MSAWILFGLAILQMLICIVCGVKLRRVIERLNVTTYRMRLLRWALKEISQPREGCGCSPCVGACRSAEALQIENDFRIEVAAAALHADEAFSPPSLPPLPSCNRPTAHAGVNAAHHSFMDRLTCRCAGCIKWRELTSPPVRK